MPPGSKVHCDVHHMTQRPQLHDDTNFHYNSTSRSRVKTEINLWLACSIIANETYQLRMKIKCVYLGNW